MINFGLVVIHRKPRRPKPAESRVCQWCGCRTTTAAGTPLACGVWFCNRDCADSWLAAENKPHRPDAGLLTGLSAHHWHHRYYANYTFCPEHKPGN